MAQKRWTRQFSAQVPLALRRLLPMDMVLLVLEMAAPVHLLQEALFDGLYHYRGDDGRVAGLIHLAVERNAFNAHLYRSGRGVRVHALQLPCGSRGVAAWLRAIAAVMDRAMFRTTSLPRAEVVNELTLLNEYTGGSLCGRRCVRLLEYIDHEAFDYDGTYDAVSPRAIVPSSREAAGFIKRWVARFGLNRELDLWVPQFGHLESLTERDLSASWSGQ